MSTQEIIVIVDDHPLWQFSQKEKLYYYTAFYYGSDHRFFSVEMFFHFG